MRLASLLTLLCFVTAPTYAQFTEVFSDNFDDGNIDGFVEFDIIGQILTGATGNPTVFHDVSFPDGGVRITSPPTPNPEFGPARTGIEQQSVSVTNFDISVDVVDRGSHLNNGWCISARTREIGPGTTDGYFFCGVDVEGGIGFAINMVQDELFTLPQVDSTAGDEPVQVASDADLRLHFRGIGNNLEASVYNLSDLDTPLATLSGIDDTYSQGFTGLAVGAGGDEPGVFDLTSFGDATFDNYSLSVPEPSSSILACLGVVLALRFRRKR